MPPVDNNAPAPSEPKKPGFFARLFGKKAEAPAVPVDHQSQTPPPQLDDSGSVPAADQTAPDREVEQGPPTIVVPPSAQSAPLDENNGLPPTLPTQPPAGESQPSESAGPQPANPSSDDSQTPPSAPAA